MTEQHKTSKAWNIILWIAQLTLASGFILGATMKLSQPAGKLAEMWPWTANNYMLVKLTGVLDMLAGLGLVLPMLLNVKRNLTVYAAYGAIALMIAAIVFHIWRGEASLIGVNIFFAAIAVIIAWGRRGM